MKVTLPISAVHLLSCAVFALGFACGCATSPSDGRGGTRYTFGSEPEPWDQSKASGASYAADDFTFRKTQPVGARNNYPFYFKHCEEDDVGSWYSKTSYECTGPLGR